MAYYISKPKLAALRKAVEGDGVIHLTEANLNTIKTLVKSGYLRPQPIRYDLTEYGWKRAKELGLTEPPTDQE